MKVSSLDDMKGGWFIGDFEPTCWRTRDFEVTCKHYEAGDVEARHVHRIATEITLIVLGQAMMNGQIFSTGDIIRLEPGEPTDFQALEDTITVVVKVPSVVGDKYQA